AEGHAKKATEYANEATDHANRAKQAANRANESARDATASAEKARKAEADAAMSARRASNAAISAEASYGAAQGYAASAFQAAEQARQSALNAGQSAADAHAKYRSTVERYQTERYKAEQKALQEQRKIDNETALQQDGFGGGLLLFYKLLKAYATGVPPGMTLKDSIHLKLDLFGLIPVIGEFADGGNCLIYGAEYGLSFFDSGEKDAWKDALLSCASMIPVLGYGATAIKATRWAGKYGGKVGEAFEALGNLLKRSSCKPKHSFPAGTRVLMADGSSLPIEQVGKGDLVHSADPLSGDSGPRRVIATIYTPNDRNFTSITLKGARGQGALTATDHHPFWTPETQSWTEAGELKTGDAVRVSDGTSAEITEVRRWKKLQPAYNLTIADLHTYYVLAGTSPVLVHNDNSGDFNRAMNEALEWLEARGFRAEKPKLGKFGTIKGKPIGMQTVDGKTGFRIEFDQRNGAHINVWSGKEKGPHFTFNASEATVTKLQALHGCR
ncbi:polymorphic toxin-type HINT domain-containing protein, partial [Streptomyces sp. NPDC005951]|uniref:polymorphic toxin-type HINT domain-containing protein n=1 Tax=Streptomyces sp. NPDC005951 TaxID=3154573 RepID=UPI0033F0EC6A